MTGSGQAESAARRSHPCVSPRRPLAVACAAVVLGTAAGLAVPLPFWPMATLCALLLLAWRRVPLPARWRHLLPWVASVLVVALYAGHRAFSIPADDLSQRMERPAERFSVRGRITGEVGVEEEDGMVRFLFPLRVSEIRRTGRWTPATGSLRVRWQTPSPVAMPAYGETWAFDGIVRQRTDGHQRSSSAFPFAMQVDGAAARLLEKQGGSILRAWSLDRRKQCARILGMGLDAFPETAGLLRALMLGYREELPEAHQRVFSRTGMLHIFAVSGLHVGVMAALAIGLLQALGLPRYRWILVLAPLLLFYTVLTGMKPSAVRACVMALSFWSASLVWRRPDPPSSLALAGICLLLWDPLQLVSPGFLLSFVVVTGLIVLGPPLHGWMLGRVAPDRFGLQLRDSTQRRLDSRLRYAVALASTSVIAWSCSAPLTASVFNLFSPVAVLGNLAVVPMAFIMVLTGCLSLLTGGLFGWMAEVFNHANRLFFSAVLAWIEWMDRIPGGHAWVPAPHWGMIGLWFSGLVVLRTVRRNALRLAAWGVLGILLLSRFGTWGGVAREAHILNLEEDLAMLWLEKPGEGVLLADVRSPWSARDVTRHMQRLGVDRLRVVISLRGGSTAKLLPALQESFEVAEWWTPDWRELLALEEASVRKRLLSGGEWGFLPGGTQWEVLVPTDALRPEGRGGLVVRLGREGTSMLVAAVGGFEVKDAMLASVRVAGAQTVVIAPGAMEGMMTARWLAWADPERVVLCAGPVRWLRDDHAAAKRLLEGRSIEARVLLPGETWWFPFGE